MSAQLFKAYDIRGLAPQELTPELAYNVGQAMVLFTKAKTVVVGRDERASTPALFKALTDGIMSQGADVIDVGKIPTPLLYFAVGEYDLHDAGVMITASHNPAQYNGFKLCYGDAMPIGGENGMKDIRDIALAGPHPTKPLGTIIETDIRAAYLDRLFSMVDVAKISGLKIAVDAANGMAGSMLDLVFARLPGNEMRGLFTEVDCSFPNHEANPLKEETLDDLKKLIGEMRADVGFAFDGDGDRVGVVDDRGETLRGDQVMALLAPRILARHPGASVMYDIRSGMAVVEEITRAGGVPLVSPVGHGLIKPRMKANGAVFAGELAYHFYFKDFYGVDCTDLVMLMILEMIAETGKPLSELSAPLRRYYHSGEINSEVEDKEAAMQRVERAYAHEAVAISKIDGIRLYFDDWWLNVRLSNTEPLLRLTLEAQSLDKMHKMRQELLGIIRA